MAREPTVRDCLHRLVEDVDANFFAGEDPAERVALIASTLGMVIQRETYQAVASALHAAPQFASHFDTLVGTPDFGTTITAKMVVRSFVREVFERARDQSLPEAFESAYADFEGFFYHDEIAFVATVPLWGVRFDSARMEIDGDTAIVSLNDPEAGRFVRRITHGDALARFDPLFHHGLQAFLRISFSERKLVGNEHERPLTVPGQDYDARAALVVNAMRVLKPGMVVPLGVFVEPAAWTPQPDFCMTHQIGMLYPAPAGLGDYVLADTDRDTLLKLVTAIKECRPSSLGALAISVHWFSKALGEAELEDRLIALMIAAESFYLPEIDSRELRYRFAQRVAAYLEEDLEKRLWLQAFAGKAYDTRSKLVHTGRRTEPVRVSVKGTETMKEYTFAELVNEFGDVMRRSLRKSLMAPRSDRPTENAALWDTLVLG